jgi:transcriptional regulator with XRE-family HTH domain
MKNLPVQPTEQLLDQVRARRLLPAPERRRTIRKQAGVSLRAMARALGVSHTAIRWWESGATPHPKHRRAYAELLRELHRIAGDPETREPDLGRAQDSRDGYSDGNDIAA